MKKITYNGVEIPQKGFGTFLSTGTSAYDSVKWALEAGYRLIDTAAVYGNEEEVGRAIKDSGIKREDVTLCTKLFAEAYGYESTLRAFDESLNRLGMDYVDIYLIHWMPRKYEDLLDTWRALEEIYNSGRARAIGLCNTTLYYLDRLMKDTSVKPMVFQFEFSPYLQQDITIEYCKEHNIVYEFYGMFSKGAVFKDERLKMLAEKYNTTISSLVISLGLDKGAVTLSKSIHKERIADNYNKCFNLQEELRNELYSMNDGVRHYRDPENNPYAVRK